MSHATYPNNFFFIANTDTGEYIHQDLILKDYYSAKSNIGALIVSREVGLHILREFEGFELIPVM